MDDNKKKFENANTTYQSNLVEKDKVIEELSNYNQLKQDEIMKLNELVKNFDELFSHYQEEV